MKIEEKSFNENKAKTKTKRLTKNAQENNGIFKGEQFTNEAEFRDKLAKWLEEKTIYRCGYRSETKKTKNWDKKETAQITRVTTEPSRENGYGDIAIHHDFLNLSWDHILTSPFIIECKKDTFRKGIGQAIRYKDNSSRKYQKQDKYKGLVTGIATPKSLSTAELVNPHGSTDPYPVNFEAKRIYWHAGIGVIQSANPDELVISFNEGDVAVIK